MIDQPTPPFRAGDTAYTRPSPGGYASAAAVPADPAFAGTDKAYTIPSLGGEFQPGSGTAAPSNSPISKGADADGGAADIAAAARIDVPPAPTPPTIPELSVVSSGNDIIFQGKAGSNRNADVQYEINNDSVERHVAAIAIPNGSSAGAAAAIVAGRLNNAAHTVAATTSNMVRVSGKPPNTVGVVACTLAAGVAMEDDKTQVEKERDEKTEEEKDEAERERLAEEKPMPGDDDDDDDDDSVPAKVKKAPKSKGVNRR